MPTYVTGAHSLKVGYQAAFQIQKNFQNAGSQLRYIFNTNVPVQVELRDAPFWQSNRTRFDAIYAQDQWTRGRLTLQGGVRYEHAWSWFPEGENGIVVVALIEPDRVHADVGFRRDLSDLHAEPHLDSGPSSRL